MTWNQTGRLGCDTHSLQRLYPHATEHGVAGLFPPSDIGLLEDSHDADKALTSSCRPTIRLSK